MYSKDKKASHPIDTLLMWKVIYGEYKEIYFNLMFQEDTLKDHLQDALNFLKTSISNEEEFEKVVLQSD